MKASLTNDDWEKSGGIYCSNCNRETVRLIDGLCPQCVHHIKVKTEGQIEDRAMRTYYKEQLRRGTISLAQMREGSL